MRFKSLSAAFYHFSGLTARQVPFDKLPNGRRHIIYVDDRTYVFVDDNLQADVGDLWHVTHFAVVPR